MSMYMYRVHINILVILNNSTGEVKIKTEFKTQLNTGFTLQVQVYLLFFLLPGLMLWKKSPEAH